jgi:Coenzyme PQQ synthesis protein D (PqqD)
VSEVRYRRSPHSLWRCVNGDVFLSRPHRQEIDLLEGTAGAAWKLLDPPVTARQLTEDLAAAYAVPAGSIEGDVGGLLVALEERGWVERLGDEDR